MYGIFGDTQWTNKERLPDHLLLQILNHFNKVNLGVKSVRDDDMGRAYEYLIKRFADKANKKAGEFYTPRSIVRLMVNVLDPQPKETVYDPACGTGGMLLETVLHFIQTVQLSTSSKTRLMRKLFRMINRRWRKSSLK